MMVLDLIIWILVGAAAGWIVSMIQRKDFRRNWLSFTLIGMSGSAVGGVLFRLIGGRGTSGLSIYSILVSVVGAFVLLAVMDWIRKLQK